MRKRADDVAQTRHRIVAAAVHLHGTIGPAATTVSALAEEAEVTRLTVYRHFPDDLTLFTACSQHWAASQDFPNPESWREISDGGDRVHFGLADIYRFYRDAEPMLTNVRRDREVLPAEIRERTEATERVYVDTLLSALSVRGKRRTLARAAVEHAVSYWTWHSLCVRNKMSNEDASDLMSRWVALAASPRVGPAMATP